MIANTPQAPYYAVIFTSLRTKGDNDYNLTAEQMEDLAEKQEGYLGIESARSEVGITVSYWKSLEAIKKWKLQLDHTEAREKGRSTWYKQFKVRICKVERDYEFEK
ncbi:MULTISPECIES: antibiotic biosynthesis monooxygenase family protein [Tenacibaculum]|uniref:antibiotic biosynthesis monooxygenase family protein n=1 Tax=Tenacibaculum TaxID=104267 RepID=UPI001F0AAF70|nr:MULTISPECIES: antibiotic biosynthesis monooxygenase [Tenacibaculum]MCH3883200.1 antibiotic biosynthesis monooxygenase [Tenacibaculum aquimarinum]MCH3885386.1 antibiotic biosynthesis monooxygenase [Tenacibaculum aquimarinum]MDO6600955.1 antibiotic biosynthesis monooxygenase [Tenacibaculum sp. 1_MG-2023]